VSTSIYDVSNVRISVTFGNLDYVLTAISDELEIVDNSLSHEFGDTDRWLFTGHGDGQAVDGYYIDSMRIFFSDYRLRFFLE
jgi:hypothetical protein